MIMLAHHAEQGLFFLVYTLVCFLIPWGRFSFSSRPSHSNQVKVNPDMSSLIDTDWIFRCEGEKVKLKHDGGNEGEDLHLRTVNYFTLLYFILGLLYGFLFFRRRQSSIALSQKHHSNIIILILIHFFTLH